jgi:hypothetical protein
MKGKAHLVLLEPFLEKLFPSLNQDGSGQLQTLALVEFTTLEEDTEVLKDRGELSRLNRSSLEHFDSLRSSENTSRRVGSDLGGSCVVSRLEHLGELTLVEIVGSGKVASRSESDGEFDVVES